MGSGFNTPPTSLTAVQDNLRFGYSAPDVTSVDTSALTSGETEPCNLPNAVWMNAAGTRVYCSEYFASTQQTVHLFTLSTPYDLTSASFHSSVDVSAELGASQCDWIWLSPDESKLYAASLSADMFQYDVGTPGDLSTASYASKSLNPAAACRGFCMTDDGTKMYLLDLTNGDLISYTLSTPYDVSTASLDANTYNIDGDATWQEWGVSCNADGSIVWAMNANDMKIYQYSVGTPGDLSTCVLDGVFDPPSQLQFDGSDHSISVMPGGQHVLGAHTTSSNKLGLVPVIRPAAVIGAG